MNHFSQLLSMSREDINAMFDTGFFNEICQGYLTLTLQAFGKSEKEINEAQSKLNEIFDFNTAEKARCAYLKSDISKFEQAAPKEMSIDEKIEYWHTHETGNTLQEFLGMTDQEYLNFAFGKPQEQAAPNEAVAAPRRVIKR